MLSSLLQTPPSGVWHSQVSNLAQDTGCQAQLPPERSLKSLKASLCQAPYYYCMYQPWLPLCTAQASPAAKQLPGIWANLELSRCRGSPSGFCQIYPWSPYCLQPSRAPAPPAQGHSAAFGPIRVVRFSTCADSIRNIAALPAESWCLDVLRATNLP